MVVFRRRGPLFCYSRSNRPFPDTNGPYVALAALPKTGKETGRSVVSKLTSSGNRHLVETLSKTQNYQLPLQRPAR